MSPILSLIKFKDFITGFIVRLIPLVLLGSITLLSFWYLQKNTLPELTTIVKSKEHKPDYVFTEAKLTVLNLDGSTKYRLLGREFRHYEDDASIDVIKPQLRLFSKNALPTTVRSETAHISGNLDIVELFKNVLVSRPNQMNLAGLVINPFFNLNSDYLEVFVNEDRLTTRLPVKIQRGESIVTATKGADYDNISQSIVMYGDVNGLIAPSNSLKR
jgi:lipopolysaccharide export system protein LptC